MTGTPGKGVEEEDMASCAFVGLGVMGYPMAGHLQAAGHPTTVYNRTTARAEEVDPEEFAAGFARVERLVGWLAPARRASWALAGGGRWSTVVRWPGSRCNG